MGLPKHIRFAFVLSLVVLTVTMFVLHHQQLNVFSATFDSASSNRVPKQSTHKFACDHTGPQAITEPDIRHLNKTVPVYIRTDTDFEKYSFHWVNPKQPNTPRAVIVPRTEHEALAAMQFLRQRCVHPRARCGGHSFEQDYSEQDGWTIHVGQLDEMHYNAADSTLTVGAGLQWREIYNYLRVASNNTRFVVGGSCVTVGVSGFLLGGGFGSATRVKGLGSDNIVEARMITSDLRVVVASEKYNTDLYWALRGGGGGNFGLVTQFKLKVHSLPHCIYGFVDPTGGNATIAKTILKEWITFGQIAPDELHMYTFVLGSAQHVSVRFVFLEFTRPGERYALDAFVKRLRSLGVETRVKRFEGTYMDYEDLSQGIMDTQDRISQQSYIQAAVFNDFDTNIADVVVDGVTMGDLRLSFYLEYGGGAIAKYAPGETAFPHRDVAICINYTPWWADPHHGQAKIRDARVVSARFRQLESYAGAYVNYMDGGLDDALKHYYKSNLARLVEVKQKWDPTGFWQFDNGVPLSL